MSAKLQVYQDVKTALTGLSFIENVLHYNGQDLLLYEKDISRGFPQAWIGFAPVSWLPSSQVAYNQNITQEQKSDQVIIDVYYAIFSLKEDEDTFETDLVNIDLIYRAITNLSGECYSPLQRITEEDNPTNNNVRIWKQSFATMLTDGGISKNRTDVAPVDLEITKVSVIKPFT